MVDWVPVRLLSQLFLGILVKVVGTMVNVLAVYGYL